MSQKWVLTFYCDKCHAGQHFEGKSVIECCVKAQHNGWVEDNKGITWCKECLERELAGEQKELV